jgi:hypothetical protein
MRRAGLTLVEILISTTLVVVLLALFAGAVTHVSRTLSHTTILVGMHEAVAASERLISDRIEAVGPCVSWRCVADPGADGVWGTGDERVELTWWCALPTTQERGIYADADFHDMDWCRLTWTGPKTPDVGSQLLLARTSGGRETPWWGWWTDPAQPGIIYDLTTVQCPRRDRRRDMDDNDLRTVEGVTPAMYGKFRLDPFRGDGSDLAANGQRLLSPSYIVEDFALSWVDAGGWETRFDPAIGLCRRDASGAPAPWLNTPWSSTTSVALDGRFVDARAWQLPAVAGEPGDPRDISAERPELLRIAFTVRRKPSPVVLSRALDVTQRFSFSFPLAPTVPAPHSSWAKGAPP